VDRGLAAGWITADAAPLSPRFQVARRLFDRPAETLLLTAVHPDVRVIGGLAATRERLAAALGCAAAELTARLAAALASRAPGVAPGAPAAFDARVVEEPDLGTELPVPAFYDTGEGAYLTAGIIAARSPRHGMNYSFHRMMLLGGNRMAVRVVPRHLHAILAEGGGRAEVAVLLGVHPAVSVAAACSGAPDLDELSLAGRLLGVPLPATDLHGLVLPADTEIVLEGRFTGELAPEGPFVDITGTLDGVRQQPVLVIDRLRSRPSPLFPVILPGGREHRLLMGLPQEPRIWNGVIAAVPGLTAVTLTPGGCSWLHAVVAIQVRHAGEGKNAGLAALSAHPSLKRVVVVDDDVDVNDPEAVEWAIATRCQPDRDVTVIAHARGSSLDPSRDPATELTAKWIIDATRPAGVDPAEFRRVDPPPAQEVLDASDRRAARPAAG
jgi:UbiD family decarboxylase